MRHTIYGLIILAAVSVAAVEVTAQPGTEEEEETGHLTVKLGADQKLVLTDESYLRRLRNGTVQLVGRNNVVVRTFPRSRIVRDSRGQVSVIPERRVRVGIFKAIEGLESGPAATVPSIPTAPQARKVPGATKTGDVSIKRPAAEAPEQKAQQSGIVQEVESGDPRSRFRTPGVGEQKKVARTVRVLAAEMDVKCKDKKGNIHKYTISTGTGGGSCQMTLVGPAGQGQKGTEVQKASCSDGNNKASVNCEISDGEGGCNPSAGSGDCDAH